MRWWEFRSIPDLVSDNPGGALSGQQHSTSHNEDNHAGSTQNNSNHI